MAITLQEAKVGMKDKVVQSVIDEFQRSSLLLDAMTFDNMVSPGTGGSTLKYGYTQLQTPSTAGVRALNAEYTANEAKRAEKTASIAIFGGSFSVDRVLQNTSGAVDEMAFQAKQKIAATANEFHNAVINGTAAASGEGFVVNTFDGLRKMLAGKSTEQTITLDISDSAKMDANAAAFLDELDEYLSTLDGTPDMLLTNKKLLAKIRAAARRAGYYERTKDDFGRVVEAYNGIKLQDVGVYYNGTKTVDVVPIDETAGTTDLYAVKFGLDAFHGISPVGTGVISSYMPDLGKPGAVKTGEVELVAGAVLKNTLKAGVLHGIQVNPAGV